MSAKSRKSRICDSDKLFKFETDLLLNLCENIDSVRSHTVYLMAKYHEWDQLVSLEIKPDHYDDHLLFADDYLVTSLLQKNRRVPTSFDKKDVALATFEKMERKCAESNERLRGYLYEGISPDRAIDRALHCSREIARDILGPLTRADLAYAERKMRFGPGATTSISGVVTQGTKYSRLELDATPRVVDFRTFCFPTFWKQTCKSIRMRKSSKLTTVPKNAKTDRVICIEPDLNIYIQLGIGALLREKLRIFGLDLNTQSTNQELAKLASEFNLCTMDLSSASDTICREAVWCLLPDRWAELLHFPRVDFVDIGGREIPLEKWSSMGNGYTFELESLLFLAVVLGCCEATGVSTTFVSVYGDDLVFPDEVRELVVETLNFLGFSVNHGKTFGKGRFHESCGADFFDGVNVRPFFLRSDHHDFPSICYLYANSARRWAHRLCDGAHCDSRLLPLWLRCFRAVEPNFRYLIPEGSGDVGFVVDFDRAKPSIHRSLKDRGWGGYNFSYREIRAYRGETSQIGCLTASISGMTTEFSLGSESFRGRFLPPRPQVGYSLEWPNLGPWLKR